MPLFSQKEVLNLKLSCIPLVQLKSLALNLVISNIGSASEIIKRILEEHPDEEVIDEFIKQMYCGRCCKFHKKKTSREPRPIIIIPPPMKPKIVLLSQDPTIDFIPIYKHSKYYKSDERRRILFAAAIPHRTDCKVS